MNTKLFVLVLALIVLSQSWSSYNRVKGNYNSIGKKSYGNSIYGSKNMLKGSGNGILGNDNNVLGNGNGILGNDNGIFGNSNKVFGN